MIGQFQRCRAISICRRTQVIDERLNTFSKNSGRTDKLKNTRISLKWEMQQQENEASSRAVIRSFGYLNCLHF